MIYCDTSFLLSLYVGDSNAEAATLAIEGLGEKVAWNGWVELEFRTGLERRVGRGLTGRAEAEEIVRLTGEHIGAGGYLTRCLPRWGEVFRVALELASRHAGTLQVRSLDIVHVALAKGAGCEVFWSFDERQNRLAEAEGLSVL